MSYAAQQQQSSEIRVGATAYRDPVLARASLKAALLLKAAVQRSKGERDGFVRRVLRRDYGQQAVDAYTAELRKLAGKPRDQAIFDAIRLAIANALTRQGVAELKVAAARLYRGAEPLAGGLGGSDEQKVGCMVTAGTTGVLSLIAGFYTAGVAAPIVGAGGQAVAQEIGCYKEQQELAQRIGSAEAQRAQAEALAAQRAAEEEARKAAEKKKKLITIAAIAGGGLLLLGAGYMIVSS